MTTAPPIAQPLTSDETTVTWSSDPAVIGAFPQDAVFQFVTPCTRATPRGKTIVLASTDLDGTDEQVLGTAQSGGQACGRYEAIPIPVTTPITLTNRRLILTVTTPHGVRRQLGTSTFLRATSFGRASYRETDYVFSAELKKGSRQDGDPFAARTDPGSEGCGTRPAAAAKSRQRGCSRDLKPRRLIGSAPCGFSYTVLLLVGPA